MTKLEVSEGNGYASYFIWYKKDNSGWWQYLGESPSESGLGSFSVYVTTTTTFAVSFYNNNSWCESPKKEITVSPSLPPSASGYGYSCQYGTAYIQVQGSSDIYDFSLYRYVNGSYQFVESNSTGTFTLNNFNTDDTNYISNYYVTGSTYECSSSYANVPIDVVRPSMPTVSGNVNPCYNTGTTLTASGGSEGRYRWYLGTNLIPGETAAAFVTGPLTASATYYVSYIEQGYFQCESPKRAVPVTVRNPVAPTPNNASACGPGDVMLFASSGFSEYSWYNQSGTLLGSSTNNTLTVPSEGLTSYAVKVKDDYGCWSGMSSSASVTTTHNDPPEVSQGPICEPGTQLTIYASYDGERAGDYYIEWYTSETALYPEYSLLVSQYEYEASYSMYLSGNKEYWVQVYDPGASFGCRTEKTYFLAQVGSAPYVSGDGYSCEYNTAYIQAQSASDIATYYLYRYEDTGSGLAFNLIQSNSTGSFTINDFYSDDTQYNSTYYLRARTTGGCWSSDYYNVYIDVLRPAAPDIIGDTNVCYDGSTLLTASGGYEGGYRWYKGDDIIEGETTSQYNTGVLTDDVTYYVSYLEQGLSAQCESPKTIVDISIHPFPDRPSCVDSTVVRCGTGLVTLEALGEYGGFQWYDGDGNEIPGATSSEFTVQIEELDMEKIFKVAGTSAEGCESGFTEITATAVSKCGNYVHEALVKVTGVTTEGQLALLTVNEKTDTWNYFDGMGRPVQKVIEQISPLGRDIVQPIVYDGFGREKINYLPYAPVSGNPGSYRSAAIAEQADFYQTADEIDHDNNPWAEKVFEPSPLNRVLEQGAPGQAWQPGTDHTVKFQYLVNDTTENIFNWQYEHNTPAIVKGTNYGTGQLYVNVKLDEENHVVREYKDKQGRVVLKKVQDAETPGSGHTGWLCTYYVYDDFNNLKAVIPPQAVSEMDDASNYSLLNDAGFSKNWLFLYKYDHRQRMVEKQVPGAEPVFMVYDKRDRLVLTQDGNQRLNNAWLFNKYDVLNRIVLTGTFDTTAVLEQHEMQNVVDTHYSKASAQWYEIPGASMHGYTNRSYPLVNVEDQYLNVTYYDDYNFPHASGYPFEPELGHSEAFARVKGLVTGNKSKILDGSNLWLEGVTYYDDKYRVIQTCMKNHKMGIDRVTNQYDFVGKVDSSLQTQSNGIVELKEYYYDHAGRLVDIYHTLNGQTRVLLSHHEYNSLGQLVDKKLHSEDNGVTFAQSIDYRYNIRGWLTAINDSDLAGPEANADKDYFGFELAYNDDWTLIGNAPAYNGNISVMKWSHALGLSAVKERAYRYDYDALNRLSNAKHHVQLTGIWANVNDFSVDTLTYDQNGNIKSLVRKGKSGFGMDSLAYDYGTGSQKSNQLISVTDAGNTGDGFIDGNTAGPDYYYDKNGNLTKDMNKGIDTIFYNYLNLPLRVEKDVYNYIEYAYDAGGAKLFQTVHEAGKAPKRTDYIGGFVYENDTLQLIRHEEGRIVTDPITGEYEYQYYLKDHLGNIRATFTTLPKTWIFKSHYESDPNNVDDMDLFEDVTVSSLEEFNHTSGSYSDSTSYKHSQVLRSSSNSQIGSAIAIPVGPGDKVTASVFAKYIAANQDPNVLPVTLASALVSAFTGGAAYPTEHGMNTINNNFGSGSLIGGTGFPYEDSNAPRAFLNLMFLPDGEEIDLVKGASFAYDQIADGASESVVGDGLKDPFDELRIENFEAPGKGYILIYVSNEGSLTDVHFDDLEIEIKEHALLQIEDYYPFGLTFNSYQRPSSIDQQYRYGGKEVQDQLNVGWLDYGARMFDPAIAKWNGIDIMADAYVSYSPYNYVLGNPIVNTDLNGEWTVSRHSEMTYRALTNVGIGGKQAMLIAHYSSYYADLPDPLPHIGNNILHPLWMVGSISGVDYSETRDSQITSWDPFRDAGRFNNNIRHSMRSPEETAANTIDEGRATLRGMRWGWNKIFESGKEGKLGSFKKNSKGIQNFGVGLHALQDAFAHKGRDINAHDIYNDIMGDWGASRAMTDNVILVHSILSGDTEAMNKMFVDGKNSIDIKGMDGAHILELFDKTKAIGKQLVYDWYTKTYKIR